MVNVRIYYSILIVSYRNSRPNRNTARINVKYLRNLDGPQTTQKVLEAQDDRPIARALKIRLAKICARATGTHSTGIFNIYIDYVTHQTLLGPAERRNLRNFEYPKTSKTAQARLRKFARYSELSQSTCVVRN